MYELNRIEIEQISGAKPLSFFSSYVLGQQGYDVVSSIGIGTAIGLTCALPAIVLMTPSAFIGLGIASLVQSGAGFYLSTLVAPKIKN